MSKINKDNFDGAYLRSSSGHFFFLLLDDKGYGDDDDGGGEVRSDQPPPDWVNDKRSDDPLQSSKVT